VIHHGVGLLKRERPHRYTDDYDDYEVIMGEKERTDEYFYISFAPRKS
jgi:hypothetical protein